MEHIVQFAVGIDDNAIVKLVTEHAEKEIIKDLKQDVINKIFQADYYRTNADPKRDKLSWTAEKLIREMFAENEQVIIDKAAALLADRLARTKKGKAILDDIEGN